MDPVPRLLPRTSPKARREGHGEGVSAQAGHLLVGTTGTRLARPEWRLLPNHMGGRPSSRGVCV